MKKSTFALACLVGLALMASCKKDPVAPTITAIQNEGYATENTQIYSGDEITVGFNATGEKLTKLEITLTENGNVLNTSQAIIENLATYSHSASFTVAATGTVTVTGTVTDAVGQTASKSFNIVCNEKPNAKFVGVYEGDALITGTLNIVPNNMDPMQQDLQDEPISIKLHMASGDDVDKVVATVTINDQESPNPINGTVEGNKVTFEALNAPFNLNYDYNGMNINIPFDMTYNITGTLNDGMLGLEGECKGNGNFNLFISGTVEIEGTIGGSLIKTE